MADAGLLGLAAAVALPAAYAHAAGRGRRMGRALAAALACYAAVAAGLGGLPEVGTAGRVAIAAAAILAADRWAGRRVMVEIEARRAARSRWGALPGALAPAACLMAVTALRDSAGAAWAGLLTPFPAATLALLVATHAEAGPAAACRVAAAVPRGSFGTLAFLATFRLLATALGPGWGAAWGVAAAVAALLAVGAITGGASAARAGGLSTGIGIGIGARRSRGTARIAIAAGGRTSPAAPGLSCVVSWSRPRPASPRCRAIRRPTRSPPSPTTWPSIGWFGRNPGKIARPRRGPPAFRGPPAGMRPTQVGRSRVRWRG